MSTNKAQFEQQASSLNSDGKRNHVHPADVSGRFTRWRSILFALFIAIYVALPWIQIGQHPAVFLDIEARRFFLFGLSFNAQDTWLLFFLLSGVGFGLFVLTALFGRVWCGYACPQTVFLEGVFRRVERWIEGPRNKRIRRNAGPMNWAKFWRKALKHAVFLLLSTFVAHIFLSYFVSLPRLFQMMHQSPTEHVGAFLWVLSLTTIMYLNFAWFREQMCLVLCPYGRLQSVMTDADTIIIGYDSTRGEPRGKGDRAGGGSGDCVDCTRCTVVCPTGIDIRNGLQLDCIGCAACVDACDAVMVKLKRAPGLIRYDSLRGLSGQTKRFWRPRLMLYAALALIGIVVATFGVRAHSSFEANIFRLGSVPFVLEEDGVVQNLLEVHVVNKQSEPQRFEIRAGDSEFRYVIGMPTIDLSGGESIRVPVFVYSTNTSALDSVTIEVLPMSSKLTAKRLRASFLRPRKTKQE